MSPKCGPHLLRLFYPDKEMIMSVCIRVPMRCPGSKIKKCHNHARPGALSLRLIQVLRYKDMQEKSGKKGLYLLFIKDILKYIRAVIIWEYAEIFLYINIYGEKRNDI